MALRVWLPLNGDLENKGISDITVTNNGATVDNNGKIGKTYLFNGNYIKTEYANYPTIFSNDFSICLWVYSTTDKTRDIYFANYGLSGGGNWFNLERDANNYLRFWWANGSPDYHNNNFIINQNEWTHITVTKSGNTLTEYKNGVLVNTYLTTLNNAIPSTATVFYLGADYRTGQSIDLYGKLNDVRIYDHCLSPLEVKEISQGLILHYKLDGFSGGNGDNILTGTATQTTVLASGTGMRANGTWSKASGGNGVHAVINIENDTPVPGVNWGFQITNNTSGNRDFAQRDQPYKNGVTYTVSWYMRGTGKYLVRQWNTTDSKQMQSKTGSVDTTEWTYYTWTFTANEELETDECTLHLGATGNTFLLEWCAMKMEVGSIATPWSPAPEDLGIDTTKIIDSSGYGNDGVITGNLTTEVDSKRYLNSTVFNGSSNISLTNFYIGNEWSYGCWIYSPTSSRGWESIILLNNTGSDSDTQLGFYTNPAGKYIQNTANGQYNSRIPMTYGQWNHFFGTFDGLNLKTYFNGELVDTKAITANLLSRTNLTIGARSSNSGGASVSASVPFNGKLSDVRIYATALSAEDIATLYHTPAQIDNLGGIHGFEINEEQANIFRYELINPYAKTPNAVGTGEWSLRNGEWAMNIKPAPFYQNWEDGTKSAILVNEIQPNTQYVVNLWIDADEVNNGSGTYSNAGLRVYYTDGTSQNFYGAGGDGVGFRHRFGLTDASKSISHISAVYSRNNNTYYRWDSYICPVDKESIVKEGLIKSTQFIENNSLASIHESGSMLSPNIIEK